MGLDVPELIHGGMYDVLHVQRCAEMHNDVGLWLARETFLDMTPCIFSHETCIDGSYEIDLEVELSTQSTLVSVTRGVGIRRKKGV